MNGLNLLDAVSAYTKTSSLNTNDYGEVAATSSAADDFTSLVEKALGETKDKLDVAEKATMSSVKGEISMEELAIAVANAEVSLKTLVSIRDKLVTALQDILRMPI